MTAEVSLLVVGGGPAGITAAVQACELGARVTMLEAHQVGGTSLNRGPAPVRTLARAARLARDWSSWSSFGLQGPAPVPDLPAAAAGTGPVPAAPPARDLHYRGGPVEFDRVVPASGNMEVRGKQFWLGTARAGMVVTFWASVDVIHLTIGGARVKSVRSHLSTADLTRLAADGGRAAGPPPIPAAEPGAAIEVDRVVSKDGHVSLGGRYHIAAEILGGQLVCIRIEHNTLMFFDPATRVLLRTRPSPLTWDQARLLRGARPAGPPPRPSAEPVTVQRRASNTGVIMVVGQKIALGRIHAGQVVTVHVAEDTITIDLGGEDTRTIRRTTTQAVRSIKAHRPRKARTAHVS